MDPTDSTSGYVALRRLALVPVAILALLVAGISAAPAEADVSPPDDDPPTVTADALPTVQINGIVWDQEVVGNVVYAAGSFSSARPAGASPGTSETPRSNLLAYDLTTGKLITGFAPTINAQVRSVAASPDGSRLYVVGDFTAVNGQTRNRIAAFDLPSGSLATFSPNVNGTTVGVDATSTTVFFTGTFGRVNGQDRLGAAAVAHDDTLLPWAPVLGERRGRVVVASPDETKVVLGGDFPTLNGSSNPGYGLGMVDADSASLIVPFQTNDVIRNAGADAAILALKSDADSFYGAGYVFGSGGNLEGSFRGSWETGELAWVNDCHGDTYDIHPMDGALYAAGHPHYCGSLVNGFPQSNPWTLYRAIAVTKRVERITPFGLNLGYFDFGGNPAPKLLHWFPTFNAANVSGAYQGPWTVNGNSEYLVYGGEFTRVNRTPQQGLVRFAVPATAPNEQGPLLWNTDWPASATAIDGAIRVSWPLNHDRDSEFLTYEVFRDGQLIATLEDVRSKSPDWGLAPLAFMDTDVTDGQDYTYRVRASDSEGHSIQGAPATARASGTSIPSSYRDAVLGDAPLNYWPLDDTDPSVSYDWAGASDLQINGGVSRGQAGAIVGEPRGSASFNGNNNGFASTSSAVTGPNSFGIEAWFKTDTTSGGKIVGFGNRSTGNSTSYDRHVFMEPSGEITFGVYPGSKQTISSAATFNDDQWHHVAAGLDDDGIVLYIDGVKVAQRTDITTAQGYNGYWRIGGDTGWSGATRFNGQIDEVAIYDAPLTRAQTSAHIDASGRSLPAIPAPNDDYGAAVRGLDPALYWRLGETAGSVAEDASGFEHPGNYIGSITQGEDGALQGVSDPAATFSGGQIISEDAFVNPRTYSLEAWFKSSSSAGGKIIGLGDSPTGDSSHYDRHVYLTPSGTLIFGVYTGSETAIETADEYNDGTWHHMVASQGPDGMQLYVDGVLAESASETRAEDFTGYWHVGGDVTWGPGGNDFDGSIDEVAVYFTPISAAEVASHFSLGSAGEPANVPPTAEFEFQADHLTVSVDASDSHDRDGTIVSYEWDFGDGATATGAQATHEYAAGGEHTLTLTVTDDRGGTDVVSHQVQAAENQPPVATFTTATADLEASVDASGSHDSDGSITDYSWDWGDGSPAGSGVTATHEYADAGTYDITLTVTDDGGASGDAVNSVTATEPTTAESYAKDDFNRSEATGFGNADHGGAWALSNTSSNYRVDAGSAVFLQPMGGAQRYAYLPSVSATDTAMNVDIALPQLPVGGSSYSTAHVRRIGSEDYRARILVRPSGAVFLQLQRNTAVLTHTLTPVTAEVGDTLHLRLEAVGTFPTALQAKLWRDGSPEPQDWTVTATDATASLQAPGHIGLGVYLGGGVSNTPFETHVERLWAGSPGGGPEPIPNEDPVADFATSASGLTVDFDASASADPDGSLTGYDWDFGDGETATGAAPSHTYTSAGTYPVTLTVTDDEGATGSLTADVTVAPEDPNNTAPEASFTVDTEDLTVTLDASGSTDPDGTIEGYAWEFGDSEVGDGSVATHTYSEAGTYTAVLTVTDDGGATGTTSQDLTVTDPPAAAPFAVDDFARPDGLLGSAPTGGEWAHTSGQANVGIEGERARLTSPAGGRTRTATLPDATSDSTDLTFTFAVSDDVATSRLYLSALGRVVGAEDYRARWIVDPGGSVQAQLSRVGSVIAWSDLTGVTVTPGESYDIRLQVFGADDTTLRSKIWPSGETEPSSWQLTGTDSTPSLQAAGYTGFSTYVGGGLSPTPFHVYLEDYSAQQATP